LYNYLHWMQKTRESYEAIRLYYVGVTRAKVSCWISGTRPSTSAWPPKPGSNIFGQLCEVAHTSCHYHDPIVVDIEGEAPIRPRLTLSRLTSDSINRLSTAQRGKEAKGATGEGASNDLVFANNLGARRFGTVLHRGLELLAEIPELPEHCPEAIVHAIHFGLIQLSANESVALNELDLLKQDLNRVLSVPNTRWALQRHEDAHNEFELWLEDEQRQIIIDRTFIDASSGVRWVIDYKTSSPAIDQDNDAFLEDQAERYRAQLQQYRNAIRSWDLQLGQPRDVKAALLFSRTAQLYEVKI
ncbi:MAG: PD-(D/E)XK nuclease family protein, partial [Luminiphilus sp.]|nr:PD-(D/E)XK nuclease family protein [Luminiphilus sp.]